MKFSRHFLWLLLAAAPAAHAVDTNIRGPSADDDGTHTSPRAISKIPPDEEVPFGARELQVRRRGGLFNPPKSARLFNPPPEDQQQQQEEEEDASTAIASTTTGTSNIFFAARSSATTNLVELAEQSASGCLLAWGPSMTTFTVICQNDARSSTRRLQQQ